MVHFLGKILETRFRVKNNARPSAKDASFYWPIIDVLILSFVRTNRDGRLATVMFLLVDRLTCCVQADLAGGEIGGYDYASQ